MTQPRVTQALPRLWVKVARPVPNPGRDFLFSELHLKRDVILDELRRLEVEVVQAELELAQQEALLIKLKRACEDVSDVQSTVNLMREQQQCRQQDRLRLLALLQQ